MIDARKQRRPSPARLGRTPGERAFDRCFLTLPLYIVFLLVVVPLSFWPNSGSQEPMALVVGKWFLFTVGIILWAHWGLSLQLVVRTWHDPAVKALRFASLALLFYSSFIIYGLIRLPFH